MSGELRSAVELLRRMGSDMALMRRDMVVMRAVMERVEATASVFLVELRGMNRELCAGPEGIL